MVIACVVEGKLQGMALVELATPGKVTFHTRVNPQFIYVGTDV